MLAWRPLQNTQRSVWRSRSNSASRPADAGLSVNTTTTTTTTITNQTIINYLISIKSFVTSRVTVILEADYFYNKRRFTWSPVHESATLKWYWIFFWKQNFESFSKSQPPVVSCVMGTTVSQISLIICEKYGKMV